MHDLPEVGQGDISSIAASADELKAHKLNEEETISSLEKQFEAFPSLVGSIKEYEKRECLEAEIVYFVDKILPVLNVWMSKDSYYRDNRITFEIWLEKQYSRIEGLSNFDIFQTLLGEQILKLLKQNSAQIFAINIK